MVTDTLSESMSGGGVGTGKGHFLVVTGLADLVVSGLLGEFDLVDLRSGVLRRVGGHSREKTEVKRF